MSLIDVPKKESKTQVTCNDNNEENTTFTYLWKFILIGNRVNGKDKKKTKTYTYKTKISLTLSPQFLCLFSHGIVAGVLSFSLERVTPR